MPISLWDMTAEEGDPPGADPVGGEVDLAIIGGGFTGLSTAFHAAGQGLSAHVIEAEKIGHGGSGRNVGLVNAGLWLPPQDIAKVIGEAKGAGLVTILGEAPAYVMSLIEQYQIRCEATQTGTIHAAHAPSGFQDLARRAEEWKRLGAPVDLLSRDEAVAKIGSEKFHGGLLDRRAGTINPMGYVRGLARIATAAGAKLSVGARATGLERRGDRWVVKTDQGELAAKKVVIGVNAYADALWPGLARSYTMIHYFNVATAPLGEQGAHILSERQGVWDTGKIMFSVRRDAFGRLVVGSMGRAIGGVEGLSKRWAARTIKRLFPEVGDVSFDVAWHGQIAMTPDHLPRIYRLADGVYAPSGYNGRGITTGTILGRAMAELAAGGSEESQPLPVTTPSAVASAPIMSRTMDMAFTANQFVKSL